MRIVYLGRVSLWRHALRHDDLCVSASLLLARRRRGQDHVELRFVCARFLVVVVCENFALDRAAQFCVSDMLF